MSRTLIPPLALGLTSLLFLFGCDPGPDLEVAAAAGMPVSVAVDQLPDGTLHAKKLQVVETDDDCECEQEGEHEGENEGC